MKPSELYERIPERIDMDINCLLGNCYSHIYEIDDYNWINDGVNKEIEIHYYKDFDFDGRRCWVLASVKFKNEFVMIFQNAGREGDDHSERFITNKELYLKMVEYIKSLIPNEEEDLGGVVEIDEDIDNLDNFYGGSLDGEFKRY